MRKEIRRHLFDLPIFGICHDPAGLPEGICNFIGRSKGVILTETHKATDLCGREFRRIHGRG